MESKFHFVPRCVSSNSKDKKKGDLKAKQTIDKDKKSYAKDIDPEVPSLLNDMVSKTTLSCDNQTCWEKGQTLEETIQKQVNPPLRDVGPLSTKRKVPVYCRSSSQIPPTKVQHKQPTKVQHRVTDGKSGLIWEQDRTQQGKSRSRSKREEFEAGRKYLPRQWELTEFGRYYERRPPQHKGFIFTVMSYNVLAQELLEDNMFLYYGCRQHDLTWKNRRRLILEELRYHNSDIICLQEVNNDHYHNFFKPELKALGYDGKYLKRSGNKFDGCATFYKTSKFILEKSVPVNYYQSDGGNVLDKDNVALIVKLRPKTRLVPSGRFLCVANTHILFSPSRGDIKLAQLMVLLAELDKHGLVKDQRNPYRYHGLLVCGDFNLVPHSPLYQLLVMGHLSYEGIPNGLMSGQEQTNRAFNSRMLRRNFLPPKIGITDTCQYLHIDKDHAKDKHLDSKSKKDHDKDSSVEVVSTQGSGLVEHNLRLVSVYDHTVARLGPYSTAVTTVHDTPVTVDYIFYSTLSGQKWFSNGQCLVQDVQEAQLELIGRFGLISNQEFYQQGSIPNDKNGSDHLSIMAKFLLT